MAFFYFDHDVDVEIARLLDDLGHDASTARDIGLQRAGDHLQLITAAQRGWIFVTHNRKDFVLLHEAWKTWASIWNVVEMHSGILIIPQPPRLVRDTAARELDAFVASGASLENELWVWRRPGTWERHP